MSLLPLDSVPLIPRPQAWLHRRHYGQVLNPIRQWGRIPWLSYLVLLSVGYIERRRSPLDPVLWSLVSTHIAQLRRYEFCIDITSTALAARSSSQDKLLAVTDWRNSTLFSEKERLALAYAEAAAQTLPEVGGALRSAMATRFDARVSTELTALTGLQDLSARFNAAMATPTQGLYQMLTFSPQNKK